jgi:hypothetical protein
MAHTEERIGKREEIKQRRLMAQARSPIVQERVCRITLSKDSPRSEKIQWCEGLGKPTNLYVLEPGGNIVWPLTRAEAYFGPFRWFKAFEESTDEREMQALEQRISEEMGRYLTRYDCPRGDGRGESPNMVPTGAHRSPDVTVEILGPNGGIEQSCRLYELYDLEGLTVEAFNEKYSGKQMTQAQIQEHYENKLAEERAEKMALQETLARLEAKFDGAVAGATAGVLAARKTDGKASKEPVAAGA